MKEVFIGDLASVREFKESTSVLGTNQTSSAGAGRLPSVLQET